MTRILRFMVPLGGFLTILSTPTSPVLAEVSLRESCPAYQAQLHAALGLLKRGDRAGAVAALRVAHDAIESCLREEGGETALAAVPARMRSVTEATTSSVAPPG